ncbi:MAG TPA: ATP-binding protein [Vicinamibacterales bacterium]|nr:ATP-binding protein [Vicinamibacterales bacterium]
MIRGFRTLAIRHKLITMIMATSVAVMLLASAGYLWGDYYAERSHLRDEIAGQAQFLSENVAAPLRVNDPEAATATLRSLASSPHLRAACLYEPGGRLFASYVRPGIRPCDPTPSADGLNLTSSRIGMAIACMLDGRRVGTLTIRGDMAALHRRSREQVALVLSLLLLTLGVATLMSARLQALVSDPILALSRTASAVSSGGDYSIRAARTSQDELGTLVDAFNGMLDRIEQREDELSKTNQELRLEVLERRKAEHERAQMLVREREANQLKDEFLATLSHELRTPLNAILGWTKLLRSNVVPPAAHDRALEKVERNAMVQARLVEDLLEVSRITTGKLRLEPRPFDLVTLAHNALDAIRPTAEARGITIEQDFSAVSLPTGGDPDRLHQVIWNLLSNAVKFTHSGGTVTIALRRHGTVDELVVCDNGIGIEPAFLPSVFETFRQADASATRAHGGLGLGLSIVRHIVELHAGTVRAASAGPGQGTTLTVELPVRAGESLDMLSSRPAAAS